MFLALVHLRDMRCAQCGASLAQAGARSFVVNDRGLPYDFAAEGEPESMRVRLVCPNGHDNELMVPLEISAEEALMVPDDAPVATDAVRVAVA